QLERHVPDFLSRAVYACAPRVMLELLENDLRTEGFDFSNYHTEQFVAQQAPKLPKSGRTHTVRFLTSRKETELDENETLLSAIESAGIVIPTGCRAGMCKACTVRLDSGATDKHQKGFQGLITTCNNYPRSSVDLWV
ncbi:MAG TPA: 2Fe-2S iron-sulfur cluster-binding protein, partial [Turneriella sp.]|nr:2Fe-2S iron-sulfur cluster-binding protein [Turneriella sp.]